MLVYSTMQQQGQHPYWLQSLILCVLGSFGGGIIAPVLIGKPPAIFSNDLILFASIIVWFFIYNLRGSSLLNIPVIKLTWLFFLGVFRTNAVVGIVQVANTVLAPSKYYPIPVFGPILAGTLLGSMGSFLPFDKGLAAISRNTPWPIQAAFYSSSFYHIMAHDQNGILGITLRGLIGPCTPTTTMVIIAFMQISHLWLQYIIHADINIFAPVHNILYLIFLVEGPKSIAKMPIKTVDSTTPLPYIGWDIFTRRRLRVFLEVGRVFLIIAGISCHIFFMIPPTELSTVSLTSRFHRTAVVDKKSGELELFAVEMSYKDYRVLTRHALPLHHSLGSCQWFASWRSCQPYAMKFELLTMAGSEMNRSEYRLAIYGKETNKLVFNDAFKNVTPLHVSEILKVKSMALPLQKLEQPQLVMGITGTLFAVFTPTILSSKSPASSEMLTVQYVPWFNTSVIEDSPSIPSSAGAVKGFPCGQMLPSLPSPKTPLSDKNNKKKAPAQTPQVDKFGLFLTEGRGVSYVSFNGTDGRLMAYCEDPEVMTIAKMKTAGLQLLQTSMTQLAGLVEGLYTTMLERSMAALPPQRRLNPEF